jgi:2-amino-4-hydroxy-6-hydroxymethyldihydropteridine diphosphokinase
VAEATPLGTEAPTWTRALIALGSNLNDPSRQIAAAVAALRGLHHCRLIAVAPAYVSAPWGPPGQPHYLNTAAILETALSPLELLRALLALERALGKVPPAERFGPRSIDLDLLTHGSSVITTEELTLPHPRLHERAFVLYPLRDIAPDDCVPGRGRVRDLAAAVDGSGTHRQESGSIP